MTKVIQSNRRNLISIINLLFLQLVRKTHNFVGTIVDSDKSQNYAISYADWIRLQDGDTVRCNVYITGKAELLDIITEE